MIGWFRMRPRPRPKAGFEPYPDDGWYMCATRRGLRRGAAYPLLGSAVSLSHDLRRGVVLRGLGPRPNPYRCRFRGFMPHVPSHRSPPRRATEVDLGRPSWGRYVSCATLNAQAVRAILLATACWATREVS